MVSGLENLLMCAMLLVPLQAEIEWAAFVILGRR